MSAPFQAFAREVAAAGLAGTGAPGPVVTSEDLAPLPEPARRYLRFMDVVGRPRDTTFRAHLRCRFRRAAGAPWTDAEAWQLTSQPDVARLFHMRLRVGRILPVYGRDLYLAGRGRLLIRPLDLFTVQDAQGPALDASELVTYLNDAVLLAPSMLLAPGIGWSAVDGGAFEVTIADRGTTVRARVDVGADGAVRDFSTDDRFLGGRERARWTTPCDGWQRRGDGRRLPTRARAVWHLPGGELPYVELAFAPGDVEFGVSPRDAGRR